MTPSGMSGTCSVACPKGQTAATWGSTWFVWEYDRRQDLPYHLGPLLSIAGVSTRTPA